MTARSFVMPWAEGHALAGSDYWLYRDCLYRVQDGALVLQRLLPGGIRVVEGYCGRPECLMVENANTERLGVYDIRTGQMAEQDLGVPASVDLPAYHDGFVLFQLEPANGTVGILRHVGGGDRRLPFEYRRTEGIVSHFAIWVGEDSGDGERRLLCTDLQTGETVWQRDVAGDSEVFADRGIAVLESPQGRHRLKLDIIDLKDGKLLHAFEAEEGGTQLSPCLSIEGDFLYYKGKTRIYRYSLNSHELAELGIEAQFGASFLVSGNRILLAEQQAGRVAVYDATHCKLVHERVFPCVRRASGRLSRLGEFFVLTVANFVDEPDWHSDRLVIWKGDELFESGDIFDEALTVTVKVEPDAEGYHRYRIGAATEDFGTAIRHLEVGIINAGQRYGLWDMNPDKERDPEFAGQIIADFSALALSAKEREVVRDMAANVERFLKSQGRADSVNRKPIKISAVLSGETFKEVSAATPVAGAVDWAAVEKRSERLIAELAEVTEKPLSFRTAHGLVTRYVPKQFAEFDPEIDSVGDYERLLSGLAKAAWGVLTLRKIQATYDESRKAAVVRFSFDRQETEWTFEDTPGWVSDEFLEKVKDFIRQNTDGELVELPTEDAWMALVFLPTNAARKFRVLLGTDAGES